MRNRIVQIGFNRAGTSSIADFLKRAGYDRIDYQIDRGPLKGRHLGLQIQENIKAGKPPLAGLDAWNAFSDMEYVSPENVFYGHRYFREIAAAHPETIFILNFRKKRAWLESRRLFGDYLQTCASFAGCSHDEMLKRWSVEWDEHLASVRSFFGSDRLLEVDIDRPDEAALSRFAGLSRTINLRLCNKAPRGPLSRLLGRLAGTRIAALTPLGVKNLIKDF